MAKGQEQIDIISENRQQFKSTNQGFGDQEVDLHKTPLFFPIGFEKIFLVIYLLTLPYLTGLGFTFFYAAKSNYQLFISLNKETPFFLTWAIGYEILATLLLLYIMKMAISFSIKASKSGAQKNFRRPV